MMVNWYYSEKLLLVTHGNDRNNTWRFWADIFESDSVTNFQKAVIYGSLTQRKIELCLSCVVQMRSKLVDQ